MGCRTTSTKERQMLTVQVVGQASRLPQGRLALEAAHPGRLRQAGFTLVETMVMAAVGSIVTIAFLSLLFVTTTKLTELTWNCYRTVMGTKVNTECMQSAKVVIRKK